MRYRLFGTSGLRVSELFLGAMTFGEQGGVGAPPEECRRILDAYADAGCNVIDTAINYRGGASEEILGEVLEGRRDRFALATKYTVSRDRDDPNAAGNHRKNLRLSLETSLRRLRTDYIDIYWVHMWDRHTPAEETMRALDEQDPAALSQHQHAVAATVQEVAGDLGATPAQVAIAWTRARSRAVHPIIGARRLDQLLDNLGAADLELPAEAVTRLDSITELDLGFPAAFIRDTSPWVFGEAALPEN
jgi:aryl-alcohol dehydrogenase-like predicted oxidoreductase